MTTPQRHHLVSKGYQRNFADATQHLTILKSKTGQVVESRRPSKRNWAEADFNTFWGQNGDPDWHFEQECARVEANALRRIREVAPGELTPEQAGAIVNVAAMHLVRSRAFRAMCREILRRELPQITAKLASDADICARFEAKFGRRPRQAEIDALLDSAASEFRGRDFQIETSIEQYNRLAERLARYEVQIIGVDDRLPGLPIGDQPVVHANLESHLYGFRDLLGVERADVFMLPLTRRVLAFFNDVSAAHFSIGELRHWKRIVDIQVRGSIDEIATHPSDATAVAAICRYPLKRPMRRTPSGSVRIS